MNKVTLMGRLTKDVEMRYSQGAEPMAVVRFSLAVARRYKKQGEPECDFLNCVAFGKTAENIDKYFSKGKLIAVVGHIQTGSYTNKDNQKVYTTDIIVDEFYFTGEKQEQSEQPRQSQQNDGFFAIDMTLEDDDLPF